MTEGGVGSSPFRRHAHQQAGFCDSLGAPFTAMLCRVLADAIPADSALGRRLDSWAGDPATDALVLRLAAGLHAAVLSGAAPDLASLYPRSCSRPSPPGDPAKLYRAAAPILHAADFAGWLESAPQTNEVGRSGPLAAGMLEAIAATGLPLALFELGASAGLNLVPDRFCLQLGDVLCGAPASPLVIEPCWEGASPPAVPLAIHSRQGVDLNPLDTTDPAAAQRMLAYVWPDQPDRLQRMRLAIAIAADDPPAVARDDAATFVETRVQPRAGVVTMVFHSIAHQYFPPATQSRIASHMQRTGADATAAAPLAWLRYEMADPARPAAPELRLKLWPGDDRLLAVGHAHGSSLKWLV